MSTTEPRRPTFIALGTRELPYLIVGKTIAELKRALAAVDALDEQGRPIAQMDVFDADGIKVPDPFSADADDRFVEASAALDQPTDPVELYARMSSVLAAQAAVVAGMIVDDEPLEAEAQFSSAAASRGGCRCYWCLIGRRRC